MEDIVIVAATRTAVGKFGGSLAKVAAPDLGAIVIKNLLERTGVGADMGLPPWLANQLDQSVHQLPVCSVAPSTQAAWLAGKRPSVRIQWLRFFLAGGLMTPAIWPEAPITKRTGPPSTCVDA